MYKEAIEDFLAWAKETFPNYVFDPDLIVLKFKEEAQEFIDSPTGQEAADVFMTLLLWSDLKGIDLANELYLKTAKNRKRVFTQNGDGTWSGGDPR